MVSPLKASLFSYRRPGTSPILRREASANVPIRVPQRPDRNSRPETEAAPGSRQQPLEYSETVVESFPPYSGATQGLHTASFARARAARIQDAHPGRRRSPKCERNSRERAERDNDD